MNPRSFLVFGTWWTWVLGSDAGPGPVGSAQPGIPVEAALMGFEKMVMKLDRLIWRLLKADGVHQRDAEGGNSVEAHSKRMFGIPVKTERQWRRLAQKIKRKERRRDMKHWKEHLQAY